MTDEKDNDICTTQTSQADLASRRNHHSPKGEMPMLKEYVTTGMDDKVPVKLKKSVKSFEAFLSKASPERQKVKDKLLMNFINCEHRNIIKTTPNSNDIKIFCPCCGKRIKRVNRKQLFINEPSGIFLMFCKVKCKQEFLDQYLEDPTMQFVDQFLARTPKCPPSPADKKERFFLELQEFLEAL